MGIRNLEARAWAVFVIRHTHIQHVWNLTNRCYVGSSLINRQRGALLLESAVVALPTVLSSAILSCDPVFPADVSLEVQLCVGWMAETLI